MAQGYWNILDFNLFINYSGTNKPGINSLGATSGYGDAQESNRWKGTTSVWCQAVGVLQWQHLYFPRDKDWGLWWDKDILKYIWLQSVYKL